MFITSPRTVEASRRLGAGTVWCTTSKDSSQFFDSYTSDSDLYYIEFLTQMNRDLKKIAVVVYSKNEVEFVAANGEGISIDTAAIALTITGEDPKTVFRKLGVGFFGIDEEDSEAFAPFSDQERNTYFSITSKKNNHPATSSHTYVDDDDLEFDWEEISESTLTPEEAEKKEKIVMALKKNKKKLKEKYGDRWESVMYAIATKKAKAQ